MFQFFDALGFIQDDDLRLETLVDFQRVGEHLLVIDDGEKRRACPVVGRQPLGARAASRRLVGKTSEAFDLLFPLTLERGGGDDQHALDPSQPAQQRAGGHGLDRFAEAHLVGEQRAFGAGEVQHPLALVGEKREHGFLRGPSAGLHIVLVGAAQGHGLSLAATAFQPFGDLLRHAEFGLGLRGLPP